MSVFGHGVTAARALRARLLSRLGAEEEWLAGDHVDEVMLWLAGPPATVFEVRPGSDGIPDLAELRVWTPVATVGDSTAGQAMCNSLNLYTTMNRWIVGETYLEEDLDVLQVCCAFVVGPGSALALEDFVLECVREQIAIATAKLTNDIADSLAGRPYFFTGPDDLPRRDWHPVVNHYDDVLTPHRELTSGPLWDALGTVFEALQEEMSTEGTGTWVGGHDEDGFSCEMPFSWGPYPGGRIGMLADVPDIDPAATQTVLVRCYRDGNPHVGNGLLLTMKLPVYGHAEAEALPGYLNVLDRAAPGGTASIGAWVLHGDEVQYVAYLPVAMTSDDYGGDPAVAVREVLLTFARQALLARRTILDREELEPGEAVRGVGLAVVDPRHGLAWGETGEGRNPGARVLELIYRDCVGADTDWSDASSDGFTWWPDQQAQTVTAQSFDEDDVALAATIRIATDVRKGVAATPGNLLEIARVNGDMGRSTLLLDDDGRLSLACRLFTHGQTDHWVSEWAKLLLPDQFIEARALSQRLAHLGTAADSSHPVNGPRPQPDELFGVRTAIADTAATGQRILTPLVARIAVNGLVALPHRLLPQPDGGLSFDWQTTASRVDVPTDTTVRVEVRIQDSPVGPGWLVRSHLAVSGDAVTRARWCNDRNVELLAAGTVTDAVVLGGWGLTADDEVCLTSWLSPQVAPAAHENVAATLLGNVMRYQQNLVFIAMSQEPNLITALPLTPHDLAQALATVFHAYTEVLDYAPGYQLTTQPARDGAVVCLTRPIPADAPSGSTDLAGPAGLVHQGDQQELITRLHIPCRDNRGELALLYAAILGGTKTRLSPHELGGQPLLPGENPDVHATAWQVDITLATLVESHIISSDGNGGWLFPAGQTHGELQISPLAPHMLYGSHALSLSARSPLPPDGWTNANIEELNMTGIWSQQGQDLVYESVLPPTFLTWPSDGAVSRLLAAAATSAIRQLQAAHTGVRPPRSQGSPTG